jgi:hypothetical protein
MATSLIPTNAGKMSMALLPTTHVSFSTDPLLAWGRLALYGTAAYLLWGKIKPASYAALTAAGACLLTSLSSPVTMQTSVNSDPIDPNAGKPIIGGLKIPAHMFENSATV